MDFLERIFGISPDGGNGFVEVLLFVVPIVGCILLMTYRNYRRR